MLNPYYFVDEYDPIPEVSATMRGPSAYVLEHCTSLRCTPEEFYALQPDLKPDEIHGTVPKIWLGVPLMLDTKVIGIIASQSYDNENALGLYEQEFLEMISPSIAATIARRRATEELDTYAQTYALLFNASQLISEALDTKVLYQILFQFLVEIMDVDFFMVSNYNTTTKTITCAFLMQDTQLQDVSEFPPLPLNPEGKGTQSRAIMTKEARLVDDYLAEVRTAKSKHYIDSEGKLHDADAVETSNDPVTRSALIVPLIFRGNVNGVIQVMSYRLNAYTNRDLSILEALSVQIGIARNNIGLYEKAQAEIEMRAKAEKDLQRLNAELEERINARTKELNERVLVVEKLNNSMANILHDLNIANKQTEAGALELREANAELEAFSYSVSHDLRAPLRHIQSFSELLYKALNAKLNENEERYFQNIFTASEKMQNLIQDMLALSRAGRVDFKLNSLNMKEMVESARADLFDETEGRNIEWKIGSLPPAQGDLGLLKIVWANLLGNAVKYTRLQDQAQIEIGALPLDHPETPPDQQTYFIRDNGVGFDEAYSDKLFGVFQRLHQGTEFEGSGVGLATVRRIITRHGGKIWAESTLNEGATFYFSLPIRVKSID